jgi:3',5'-cyclic AMP phosphodiesterase CpdA
MRAIAHLSDLHFGREDPRIVEALVTEIDELAPTVVAVSGDFTQRARQTEFRRARAFLDRLRQPLLAVAGNHDVPLWNVYLRAFAPFTRYRKWIDPDLEPVFVDDELCIVAVNTARAATFKSGRISSEQLDRLAERTAELGDGRLLAVVTHHPLVCGGDPDADVVADADRVLDALHAHGVELLLSGHLHGAHSVEVVGGGDRRLIAVHAGTAVSSRLRGESNSYNQVFADERDITVGVRSWNGERFESSSGFSYRRRRA